MTILNIDRYRNQIRLPSPDSHKGQNGKVMVIGGSELFHAASQWALTVVSRMVDMVFYSSVPGNNELIKEAKLNFHNGIVIPRQEIENYIEEADVVLIGPGMERKVESDKSQVISENKDNGHNTQLTTQNKEGRIKNQESRIENQDQEKNSQLTTYNSQPTTQQWNNDTEKVVNYLLSKYPDKKWVIDAGALQMVDPSLLNQNCIITPHQGELERVLEKLQSYKVTENQSVNDSVNKAFKLPHNFPHTTMILKGKTDQIISTIHNSQFTISGGNQGMTKGGTGDVLAGLVAGLYAFSDDPFAVAVVASKVNKMAGDELFEKVGPFFNASDLADQIPKTLAKVFGFIE